MGGGSGFRGTGARAGGGGVDGGAEAEEAEHPWAALPIEEVPPPWRDGHTQSSGRTETCLRLFGGAVTDTCVTEQVEIYCPTTDVWTVRAPSPANTARF
eukprot:SAG25_NODE_33_length_20262_cov_33.203293_16_plen_99_part_00